MFAVQLSRLSSIYLLVVCKALGTVSAVGSWIYDYQSVNIDEKEYGGWLHLGKLWEK